MQTFQKSNKLEHVLYDIRGPIMKEAVRLEEEGFKVMKLNIGNPAPFGLDAPEEIIHDMIINMHSAQGYCDSKGLFSARKAVMHRSQELGIAGVEIDDIYIGNGVSELIQLTMQGLCNAGTEILVPSPDYPLWTASVNLAGGKPVHYLCDEKSDWQPDLRDMARKITQRTKAVVVINPNNPTGAVYAPEILEGIISLARRHGLMIFADEIYDKITYDGIKHTAIASLADDLVFVTFSGLSKGYRAAGFRAGWMILSGNKALAKDYVEGLEMLSNMRLCSNVPAQLGIQTALGGYQSINDLIAKGGRLREQRDYAHTLLNQIPGVSCVKPKGALYLFPKLDTRKFRIRDDMRFALDLLRAEKVQVVQGTGFNWHKPDHFRIVFLPAVLDLETAIGRIGRFLETYRQTP